MRKVARRHDIRDLILDGVDSLLARFGYGKMTMSDLARQVGIGKGTIYLHFPSKQELALAHVDRIVERLLGRLHEIAAREEPPGPRIKMMLVTRVLHRYDAVVHYSQNLNDLLSAVREELLVRRHVHFEREAKVICGVIEEGLKQGVFHYSDSRAAARILIWSTNSLLPFSLTARELGKRKELEERASRIADLLIAGLRPLSPSRAPRGK
jgi:AcrR family transcriptional regulator